MPDKEAIADTSALVVHLADAQVDIAGNTSEVAPLDVATTTRMFTFVELAHFLCTDLAVAVIHLAGPEEGMMLAHIDEPLHLGQSRPPNVTVRGRRTIL